MRSAMSAPAASAVDLPYSSAVAEKSTAVTCPPGCGEPDRLGPVPAARVKGETWLHVSDLRQQIRIRRPTRHLLRALAQGLSPAPLSGAPIKRLVRHDITSFKLLNANA